MNHYAVIGAGFGDEGKGLVVDYLTRRITKETGHYPMVIRHNGTSQATHTVKDGDRQHRFSHYGSGTFAHAVTYLAKTFFMNPCTVCDERDDLASMGAIPTVAYDGNCNVILPYDIAINMVCAIRNEHGSCGMGLYPAFKRGQLLPGLVTIRDVVEFQKRKASGRFCGGLADTYYDSLLDELDICWDAIDELCDENDLWRKFYNGLDEINSWADMPLQEFRGTPFIFEGAQGLLLDPNYGTMPYCTPSDTGLINPVNLLNDFCGDHTLNAIYVTRTYRTRHGAGPFPEASVWKPYDGFSLAPVDMLHKDTNKMNTFQGGIRYAPYYHYGMGSDACLMAIAADVTRAIGITKHPIDPKLFITWIDAVEEDKRAEICERLSAAAEIPLFGYSRGPEAKHVSCFDYVASMNVGAQVQKGGELSTMAPA